MHEQFKSADTLPVMLLEQMHFCVYEVTKHLGYSYATWTSNETQQLQVLKALALLSLQKHKLLAGFITRLLAFSLFYSFVQLHFNDHVFPTVTFWQLHVYFCEVLAQLGCY